MDSSSYQAPIAIIGIGCRFPGADNLEEFKSLLLEGRCAISELAKNRFNQRLYYDPEVGAYGKAYTKLGGSIRERAFDWRTFRMPPKVVESTDIIHLWGLEVAKETFEHAGLEPFGLQGANIGVLLGHARGSMLTTDMAVSTAIEGLMLAFDKVDALQSLPEARRREIRQAVVDLMHKRLPHRTEDGGPGTITSAMAGIITSVFGLTGRHVVVDAACASSFAAMDVAIRGLRQGTLDMALAGGASYSQQLSVVMFSQSRALSAEGSFPFDERANGFISSDGLGMVLLERLEDAVAKGRTIHGLIRGLAGSCDGRGKGLWAPDKRGQKIAIEKAYQGSGVSMAEVGLIEAHGTSTALGDATEVEALTETFGPRVPVGVKIPIGSVKSNIGHCREAAGIAGLIKVLVAFETETIPPSICYQKPNPAIQWEKTPLRHATLAEPWRRGSKPRIAAVDTFGIGGLNYHIVLEEPPSPQRRESLLQERKSRVVLGHKTRREPLAIVGIGCILPDARGPEQFWRRLCDGHVAMRDVPDHRWSAELYYQPGERATWRTYTKRGAFLEGFQADWRRYRIPPKLIERNDPLQFMLLESALEALDDAGIDPKSIDRQRVMTCMGSVFGSDFALELALAIRVPEVGEALREILETEGLGRDTMEKAVAQLEGAIRSSLPEVTEDSSGSFSSSTLASRIAKTLDLRGPTFSMDAACSSSLASMEAVCEALWAEDCDVGLFGGGDRSMRVQRFEGYCQFLSLSRSDRCAPFDAAADGFLPGEGAAVCVVKRLSDAQAEGDKIYAVIRGIGSASDGERKSLHKSSPNGLARAMQRAYEACGVAPETVDYVECHGAGTVQGDATEIEAVRRVIATGDRKAPVLLGSVKSNIGHTQGAAGVSAVVKAALSLHHGLIPPTASLETPNPALAPDLEVSSQIREIDETEGIPRAGVSSMGLAGINYHVVLEKAPPVPGGGAGSLAEDLEAGKPAAEPFVVRAGTLGELRRSLNALGADTGFVMEAGAVYGRGPAAVGIQIAGVAGERLGVALAATEKPRARAVYLGKGVYVAPQPLEGGFCFLFPGQGSQYSGMLREIAGSYRAAAKRLVEMDHILARQGLEPLSVVLWERPELLSMVKWTQLAVLGGGLMMLEVAKAHGLEPGMVTGHSYGDYPSLVAVGSLSVEGAIQATLLRCEAIMAADRPGAMVSVFAPRERLAELLEGLPGYAAESNINSPEQIVVSGTPPAIDALLDRAERAGVTARRLSVPRAFHSELMRPAAELLRHRIGQVEVRSPSVRYLCSVGPRELSTPEEIRRALVEQLTLPVDYVTQIEVAYAAGYRRFVEMGPGNILTRLTRSILGERPAVVVSLDDKKRSGIGAVERALAALRSTEERVGKPIPGAETGLESGYRTRRRGTSKLEVGEVATGRQEPEKNSFSAEAESSEAALFTSGEWRRLVADPGWRAFWVATRPSLAMMARHLFEQYEKGDKSYRPSALDGATAKTVRLYDATERRRERIAQEVKSGRFQLPGRKRPPSSSGSGAASVAVSARELSPSVSGVAPAPTVAAIQEPSTPVGTAPGSTQDVGGSASPELAREVHQFLIEQVIDQTGYPEDLIEFDLDMEADLGIDTVKQAQVFGKVREKFDLATDEALSLREFPTLRHVENFVLGQLGGVSGSQPAAAEMAVSGGTPEEKELELTDVNGDKEPEATGEFRSEIEKTLVDLVCEQSGYPPELIELDLDLEADLGIDTVKQAQVLGKVREVYDLPTDESLSLRDFPTLNHVAAYVEESLAPSGAPVDSVAASRQSVPPSSGEPALLDSSGLTAAAVEGDTGNEAITAAKLPPVVTAELDSADTAEDSDITRPLPRRPKAESREKLGQIPLLRLQGTPYEMGFQHGRAQREEIQRIVETFKEFIGDEALGREVLQNALKHPEQYFDERALEEIRGLADGAGLPYRYMLAYNLDSALFPEYGLGCSQIGLSFSEHHSKSSRGVLHAVNEDSPLLLHLGAVLTRVVQVREPEEGLPHLTFSQAGQMCGFNGVNAGGLVVTSCVLLDRDHAKGVANGLIHPILVRRMLEGASSSAEAVEVARTTSKTGSWSVMLSHPSEETLRFFEYEVDHLEEASGLQRQFTANHAVMLPSTAEVPEHSQHRFARLGELLAKAGGGPVELETLEGFLRDRFDGGRGRDVAHRTMNTVCRVDNVMGLVVDTAAGILHVTDRVGGAENQVKWRELRLDELFGSSSSGHLAGGEGVRVIDPAFLPGEGGEREDLNFSPDPEVMTRYLLRTEIEDLRGARTGTYQPRRALIVGAGPVAEALKERLDGRGAVVECLALGPDLAERGHALLERGPLPDLFLLSAIERLGQGETGLSGLIDQWPALKKRLVEGPYWLLQDWSRRLGDDTRPVLAGVTALGGAMGQANLAGTLPEGGAVAGLFKALRREFQTLRVKVLDVESSERPAAIADALLAELDSEDRRLEVGLLRGRRRVLRMAPCRARVAPERLDDLRRLGAVVVTGGARGVTAEVVLRLARLGVRRLHLLGRTPLPVEVKEWRQLDDAGLKRLRHQILERLRAERGKVTPVEWERATAPIGKALEIDRNLRRLAAAGASPHYHALDVSDSAALRKVLQEIREADGPIEAVIHGAGHEASRSFLKKTPEELAATIGAKLDGFIHLISSTASDPIRLFVGFSSVSGRFGGMGQADYALASDMLSRVMGAHAAKNPACRAVAISWPAWDEVGMAVRKQTRHLLEASGQKFMGVREGGDHFLREILAEDPELEVTIVERLEALDLDRLLPDEGQLQEWRSTEKTAARLPMVDAVLRRHKKILVTECRLNAGKDPFLTEHRIGPTPILPAVAALEMMADTARLAMGDAGLGVLEGATIHTALKLSAGGRASVRCLLHRGDAGMELTLMTDFVGRGGRLIDPDRRLVSGRASTTAWPGIALDTKEIDGRTISFSYRQSWDGSPRSIAIYHGPPFRALREVTVGDGTRHRAKLVGLDARGLRPSRQDADWWLPAPVLDSCLQACGVVARARLAAAALPGAFGKIGVFRHPRPGEACRLHILLQGHEERRIHFDFLLLGEEGEKILAVEDYVANTFAPVGSSPEPSRQTTPRQPDARFRQGSGKADNRGA